MSRRARAPIPARERRFQRDMSVARQEWRFEVGLPDGGERIDAFLASRLRWRSRSQVQRLIAAGRVEVNEVNGANGAGDNLRPSTRLRAGQEIVLWLDAAQEEQASQQDPWAAQTEAADQATEIHVVYEDHWLLAVNKPPRMNLYPSRRHRGGSLIELVHRQVREPNGSGASADRENSHPPSPCHRLDRETSGLVLFAKDPITRAAVGGQLEARTVHKTYLAVVLGEVAQDQGTIDLALGPDPRSRVEIRRAAVSSGEPALTRFRVLERLEGRTLVELSAVTGRQHQLRVHLAAIGHPIVGDKLYLGGDDVFLRSLEGELCDTDRELLGLDRQALHAFRLELDHPQGRRLTIEARLWPDIASLIRSNPTSETLAT